MSAEPVELSTHLAASGRIFSPHFEVSKQAHLLDPNFFRFKGLSEGVYRLRPPPPNNGPKTTDQGQAFSRETTGLFHVRC